jgi:hypothetical protein
MATARRHHYVPRCYLKGFTVPRKKKRQIVVFDRVEGRSFLTAVDNIGAERDFNRVELEGNDPDVVEAGMAVFEGKLAPVLERVIATGSLGADEDRVYLMNLIGLLAIRNPRWRETWRDFEERVVKVVADMMVSTPEHWASTVARARKDGVDLGEQADDYELMRKFVKDDEFTVEVPTERHIAMEMHGTDVILPPLIDRKWMLLRAAPEVGGFVTSDHPVCLMWSSATERGRMLPPGYGMTQTQVIFPIATSLAMIGAFEMDADADAREASESMVAAINATIASYAERQVYSRDMHFRYAGDDGTPRKASRLASEQWFRRGPRRPSASAKESIDPTS